MAEPLPTSDNRRAQSNPSLGVSLEYLDKVFDYLDKTNIRVFRMPSNVVPYATHPDHPELWYDKQIATHQEALTALGQKATQYNLRLSFHPSQYILLSSPDKALVERSVLELAWQADFLDQLGQSLEARVLLHAGGVYNERERTKERIIENVLALPENVKRRFALENDDVSWSAREVLDICQTTKTPMIFDIHHHHVLPNGDLWRPMIQGAMETWPKGLRPKIHFSSSKTDGTTAPKARSHADYIDPFAFLRFSIATKDLDFDVMLEAKAKDLAVLELRKQMAKRCFLEGVYA